MDNKEMLAWLLEEDNPSVRYFTLRDILGLEESNDKVGEACKEIMESGPVPEILALQSDKGWWDNPDSMSMPMYLSTAWQLMLLAELGTDGGHERIRRAVELIFAELQKPDGSFPHEGERWRKKHAMDLVCNDAMIAFGLAGLGVNIQDERMARTFEFLANTLIKEEYECRFNKGAQCAWGVVKMLRVLAYTPAKERTVQMVKGIESGAEYLLNHDLACADFPYKENGKISEHWFRLGFPRSYQADLMQTAFILAKFGYGKDCRLQPTIDFLLSKRLPDGTWALEDTWNKFSVPFVKKSKTKPSKWITWQMSFILGKAGRVDWNSVSTIQ